MHIYMDVSGHGVRRGDQALTRPQVCEGGDLDAFIADRRERDEPLEEETIWKLFSQLVQALHYCHDPASREDGSTKAVIHRDLKPANSEYRESRRRSY